MKKIKDILKEKKNFLLLCWPIGLLMLVLSRSFPEMAEKFFCRIVYRGYGAVMSRISGIFPFSVAELTLICVPVILIVLIIRRIVLAAKNKSAAEIIRLFRNLLITVGIVFLWYMIGCGTNYYRYEFKEFSGLEVRDSSVDELKELCAVLAEKTNNARTEVAEAENDVFTSTMTNRELATEASKAMTKLSKNYECLEGYFPNPKPVFFSRFMSRFEITGVYFPFTVEANVDVDISDYAIGVTMCHELVHLRGFMREDEANFIAYLACKNSDSAELRYSGYMLALIYAGNRLYSEDKEAYIELYNSYSDGVKLDLYYNSLYWDQFKDTTLSEVGENVNNAYLKANKQTDGTKSYGRMVDLLLAELRSTK